MTLHQIEAIIQLVDFRHETSGNLKENMLPACVTNSHIGVVEQQEKLNVPCNPFASITTPPQDSTINQCWYVIQI